MDIIQCGLNINPWRAGVSITRARAQIISHPNENNINTRHFKMGLDTLSPKSEFCRIASYRILTPLKLMEVAQSECILITRSITSFSDRSI